MNDKQKYIKRSDTQILKWVSKICSKQIPMLVLLIVLNAIYGLTSVFFANFSKQIIDGATEYQSENLVLKYALALLGLVLFQMFLAITKNSLSERVHARLDMILKKYLLDVIMRKDYPKITSYHTGDLQNRMFNDVEVVTEAFTNIVPQAVFYGTKLISSLIYLIVIDKIFAIVLVIGGLLVFITTQALRKTLKRLHRRVQETEGKTRSFIQEIVTNLLVIKAFSVEHKIDDNTDALQEENFKARIKRRNFSICANVGLGAVFNIGTVFAVAYGAWSILNADMTYGTVTAIIQLVNQVQSPFVSLSGIMPKYYSLLASAERLIELDEIEDEENINAENIDLDKVYSNLKKIEFENISFSYDRDIILDNTSFTVEKGDFVAIMGISGIGKSTLLKLLLGVFKVNDGKICLDTDDGNIEVDKNTRRLFAYVPQGNMLISGTIRDNLTFINDNATDEEIEQAIRISCAKQFIDELPLGLDTVIGEKGMGLSEGQVQRLAIARSLLSNSPVLLLDEATSALDEETEKQFLTNLKTLDNVTCIIVSHKKAALEICNKRIQILHGKIISDE
ncbi:MAG: ABC transporter ATP-binding protein/permease [Clostridiales bacterium]|nr:ABC transporter ATP-binding protein/permease [Clostridiales bacterium]